MSMRSFLKTFCFVFFSTIILCQQSVVAQIRAIGRARAVTEKADEKDKDKDKKKKELDKRSNFDLINEKLADVVKLDWKGQSLAIAVPESYQEANQLMNKIREVDKNSWVNGSNSGKYWVQNLQGQNFSAVVRRGDYNSRNAKTTSKEVHVEYVETSGYGESLEMYGKDENEFSLRISGGLKDHYLQAKQTANGFTAQYSKGKDNFAGHAANFEQFCKDHSEFLEGILLPSLRFHGVSVPVTRYHPFARKQVMASITPPDPERVKAFRELFGNLDSKKFKEREEATKLLNEKFKEWKDVLELAVQSQDFSFETRSRINDVISKNSKAENRDVINLVGASRLNEDTEYLVWMLSQVSTDEKTKTQEILHITNQLQKLTNEKLGTNVAAWQSWLEKKSKSKKASESEPAMTSLATIKGLATAVSEPTSVLLNLQIDSKGKLQLNRESWKDYFGGKSISDLTKEVREEISKRNLPANWFTNRSGGGKKELEYPHVLFEKVQHTIPRNTRTVYYGNNLYSYGNRSSLNRQYDQPHAIAKIQFHEIPRVVDGRWTSPPNKVQYFHYELRERRAPGMKIEFMERKDSSLRLMIGGMEANQMLVISQDKEGEATVCLCEGGKKTSMTAKTFKDLFEQNKDLLKEKIFPILSNFGVQFDKAIGGPFEIATSKTSNTGNPQFGNQSIQISSPIYFDR